MDHYHLKLLIPILSHPFTSISEYALLISKIQITNGKKIQRRKCTCSMKRNKMFSTNLHSLTHELIFTFKL